MNEFYKLENKINLLNQDKKLRHTKLKTNLQYETMLVFLECSSQFQPERIIRSFFFLKLFFHFCYLTI